MARYKAYELVFCEVSSLKPPRITHGKPDTET